MAEDGNVVLRVRDEGQGIARVREVVRLHGGSVEASSEGLGKGSTFTVRRPLLIAQ